MKINSINQWRFIDQTTFGPSFSPLASFAIDDTLCVSVCEKPFFPVIRTWVHHNTIVLGIQDSRLPFIEKGINLLKRLGYQVIVRNSGGLAVVLDEGIVSISLIYKEEKQISINDGYKAMYEIIQAMFKEETDKIEAREIIGSYCPGSYDLSIGGKKFAGMSQRRVRGGVAVQTYLCINGSGSNRAALIKEFYQTAAQHPTTKILCPTIIPSTMASLNELLQLNLNLNDVIHRLLKVMKRNPATVIQATQLLTTELPRLQKNLERMKKRNED